MLEKILSTQDHISLQGGKMEARPELENRLEKLKYFLAFCLEDFIKENLIALNEKIEVAALQKPEYNNFDKHYYAYGLLRIGKKYLPLQIEAGGIQIIIKAKPFRMSLSWAELEEAIRQKEASNQ